MTTQVFNAVAWYVAILLLGWLALPLTFRLFRWLPERGYGLAKSVGLLLAGYLYWLLGSLGLLANQPGSILLAVGLTAGIGLAWQGRDSFRELREWLGQHRRYVLAVEALFLGAYLLWVVVRAYNPDILGTEKPMEFMFLNAILRSPMLPPQDAWLSGHAVSYYYFGFLLMAVLTRLTGAASAVAFNLSLALLFALTAVNASAILVNLITLVRRRAGDEGAQPQLLPAFWPSLLAPVLILLIGNWYGALELVHRNALVGDVKIPAVWYDYGGAGAGGSEQQPPGVKAGSIGIWQWLDLKGLEDAPAVKPPAFEWRLYNWFFASRVLHDRSLTGQETEAIDEFPAFSFLLGDLHPHVLALPFVVLAAALALNWMLMGREAGMSAGAGRITWPSFPLLLASAAVLGSLVFLNTWDFPIYWFLTGAMLVCGLASAGGWGSLGRWGGRAALWLVGLLALAIGLYLPFFMTFQSQAGGFLPNLVYPSRIQQTVVMFGPLLVLVSLFTIWSAWRWRSSFDRRAAIWTAAIILLAAALYLSTVIVLVGVLPDLTNMVAPYIQPLSLDQAASLLWQRRLVEALSTLLPVGLMALAVGLAAGLLDRLSETAEPVEFKDRPKGQGGIELPLAAALVLVLTGALLLLAPEYIYLRDNFGTRMNTIFKFYFQVWVLWSLAAAFGFWCLLQYGGRAARWTATAALLLAILPGAVYLPGSLQARTGGFAGPPTLDGMAYFARNYPNDWAVIQWMNENIHQTENGAPVILEGTKGAYWIEDRSSRISMATGLPTILGWANHENQWRGEYYGRVAGRENDIRQIYQERDWLTTQALLDEYGVDFIVVSPLEENWYRPVFAQKFEQFLTPVFRSGDTVVYRVDR